MPLIVALAWFTVGGFVHVLVAKMNAPKQIENKGTVYRIGVDFPGRTNSICKEVSK